MSTPQPYAGISAQRLVALINAKNNTNYQLGVDFTLGAPSLYVDTAGRNTAVTLTPVSSTYQAEDIHYYRLPLTALNALPAGSIVPVSIPAVPFTLSSILPAINTALGLNLTADEIVDQTYTVQQDSYALHINNATCLAWVDSAFTFAAQFPQTGGGDPFIGVRPGWFAQLDGSESTYYPLTLNAITWAAPLGSVAGAIPNDPSQWKAVTGTLTMVAGGAFFDLAVIDPSTGLPAAVQPSWVVNSDAASVAPKGTYSGAGFQTIYSDDEATLVVLAPAAGATPPPMTVTGTYEDSTTITATVDLALATS